MLVLFHILGYTAWCFSALKIRPVNIEMVHYSPVWSDLYRLYLLALKHSQIF